MKRLVLFVCSFLLLEGVTATDAPDVGVTSVPLTYVMVYAESVPKHPDILKTLREAPPNLLHVGHAVPLNSIFGPAGDYSGFNPQLVPAQKILDRREELRAFVEAVRETGVDRVICYINPSILGGDHETRDGFWAFYDHWDDYAQLGIGPKPERTPEQWMQRERRSFAPWEPEPNYRQWRYQPCMNEPAWVRYQEAVVRLIVESGYDGVFVDDCIMECRHDLCQLRFAQHLRERYNREQRRLLWGDELQMAGEKASAEARGEPLRRAETFLFWQQSVVGFLQGISRLGRETCPDFMTVPNWGAISRVGGAAARARSGKSVAVWSVASDYQMFEEDHPAGSLDNGDTFGHLPQYLHALALGVRPVILTYATSEPQFELGYAECAAGGGGAFVQAGLAFPDIRRKWRAFYAAHPDLFQGHQIVGPVGVVVSFDELRFGNDSHLLASYALTRVLMAHHVPFAVVPGERLGTHDLLNHSVLILPNVQRLSEAAVRALRIYVSNGGSLLSIGECGVFDEVDTRRSPGDLADLGILEQSCEPQPSPAKGGRTAHARQLEELIEDRDIAFIRALDARDPAVFRERLLRLPGPEQALRKRTVLLQWLRRLADRPLSIADSNDTSATRTVVYQRLEGDRGTLCAHAIRYAVCLETGTARPTVSKPFELHLPIPQGWTVRGATVHRPGEASLELPTALWEGSVHCSLPAFEFYALLSVGLERSPQDPTLPSESSSTKEATL